MVVQWSTADSVNQPVVQYGTSADQLSLSSSAKTEQYNCLQYSSPQLHHAVISDLSPSTTYYYRVGDAASNSWSDVRSFTTGKIVGDNIPVTFAILGDLGQTSNSNNTIQHILNNDIDNIDTILHVGDMSYADSFMPRWDSWFDLVEPISSKYPYMTTIGNHDLEPLCESIFKLYNYRFKVNYVSSQSSPPSDTANYYSFEIGSAHIISLNSYGEYSTGTAQYNWLVKDLASIDRSLTPWVIIILHAPWYNSNNAHHGEADYMLAALEDLIHEYRVDIMFAGHVHAYERSYRVYKGQRDDQHGCYYVTIGDGGNREGLASHYLDPQPQWSAFRQAEYGYGTFSILNSTHAQWKWYRNMDDLHQVTDQFMYTSIANSR